MLFLPEGGVEKLDGFFLFGMATPCGVQKLDGLLYLISGRSTQRPQKEFAYYHIKRARRYRDRLVASGIFRHTAAFHQEGIHRKLHSQGTHVGEVADVGHGIWAICKMIVHAGERYGTAYSDGAWMEGYVQVPRSINQLSGMASVLCLIL